ncbi:ADP-glyceromanno-heptose 6-epimerase [Maridesulfovibrio salexigens]|uniref:ADP-L-glycero-D-manno-heptose-6-epimerase n=1 Tax=Maridesulfovibrio salexigens (strain ATCC 14822 / DSM 2638 / NCIMB 8403 / VKM B-1763) TaxID=526222 RepID=C6BY88_MARSD|nr:ADP-glyceromanno-heptose 6-epimerase [Maridesulfovibrio salexigens]ACS78679.1 ADP-L-glycero-D-manno-heptose-6-epimerase [Maridesulfovibrio salexigens DSM 2638]
MYIVTGGAGFIGSAMVWKLNQMGIDDILIVDNLAKTDKWKNLVNLRYEDYIHRDQFFKFILEGDDPFKTDAVIHMGACSSTTEQDADFLMENNYRYTQMLCRFCLQHDVRFINASSAATYGDGQFGFDDDHEGIDRLKPMNMYGYSKQLFDLWAKRGGVLDKLVSLKFFNVFGPNEYHKDDMKSVICKAFHQIGETEEMKLFKSYKPEYPHGGQKRDFVYIKDCVDVMWWFLQNPQANGIFNIGTGQAREWNELARSVFAAMDVEPNISYIEMPETIRDKYQYFTQANMSKLVEAGYDKPFTSLEDAAKDYVQNYLAQEDPYLKS